MILRFLFNFRHYLRSWECLTAGNHPLSPEKNTIPFSQFDLRKFHRSSLSTISFLPISIKHIDFCATFRIIRRAGSGSQLIIIHWALKKNPFSQLDLRKFNGPVYQQFRYCPFLSNTLIFSCNFSYYSQSWEWLTAGNHPLSPEKKQTNPFSQFDLRKFHRSSLSIISLLPICMKHIDFFVQLFILFAELGVAHSC